MGRMSRLRVAALVAVWLVVVAGVSALVWVALSGVQAQTTSTGQLPVATAPIAEPSPTDDSHQGTWQGLGGLVVAACDADQVRLVSAQPVDGFRVEVNDASPDQLVVDLEEQGRNARTVSVTARCQSGVPTFTSQTDADSH